MAVAVFGFVLWSGSGDNELAPPQQRAVIGDDGRRLAYSAPAERTDEVRTWLVEFADQSR